MIVKEILQRTADFFKTKGIESARLDAELLIGHVLKLGRVELYLKFDYPLKENELEQARELVKRRATGEPVAYILGRKDFFKSTFFVNKYVLVPRPETEELVEAALKFLAQEFPSPPDETTEADIKRINIIDLGTGSGCIGLSLIKERPQAKLLAVDLSEHALHVARQNAASLQVQERAVFVQADAGELSQAEVEGLFGSSADLVVANPPYIANNDSNVSKDVRAHEPSMALFAEGEGLREIERWATTASRLTRPGAMVIFELGASQGQKACEIFSNLGKFERIEILKDLSGRDRFIRAFKI